MLAVAFQSLLVSLFLLSVQEVRLIVNVIRLNASPFAPFIQLQVLPNAPFLLLQFIPFEGLAPVFLSYIVRVRRAALKHDFDRLLTLNCIGSDYALEHNDHDAK